MNQTAFPVMIEKRRRLGVSPTVWRVWRPDREPHLYGYYLTEQQAQCCADVINQTLKQEASP